MQDESVAATAKHFPGGAGPAFEGVGYIDSHFCSNELRISKEDWAKEAGSVFQRMIDGGVYSIMISHMGFPAVDDSVVNGRIRPSTISKKVITDLLKNDIKVILVSATVCNFRNDISDLLRQGLSEKYGVPFENIILSATHTHSGPALSGMFGLWGGFNQEYHDEIFKPALFSAVEKAIADMEPITMATVSGKSNIGVNRRILTMENKIDFGQCKWGPYNPEMVILSFKGENGKIKGNLVCYGAHGTAAGATTQITRDWSGVMTDALEEKTGGLTSFLLGPEGDVAPRVENEIRGVGRIGEMEKIGKKAAVDALAIFEKITDADYIDADITIRSDVLHLPVKPRPTLEDAKEGLKNIPENPIKTMDFLLTDYYTNVIKSYDEGYKEVECEEVPQIIFRLGNIVFVTFSYEIFSEIGMRINEAVEEYKVVSLVVTNGQGGYLPTQSQLCLGGYEVNMFKTQSVQPYVDDADFHMIKETVRNVKETL